MRSGELRRSLAWAALIGVSALAPVRTVYGANEFELRLVGIMHESLAALTRIQEGLAREDYRRVREAALHLESSARTLQGFDLGSVGLDAKRDAEFDRYLERGAMSARTLADAAQRRDPGAVIRSTQQLLLESCVACHSEFREVTEVRTPRVLFMRTLLSSVQNIQRGIALGDFARVAREAREIGAVSHVFAWTRVVDALFEIRDPKQQARFRHFLEQLSSTAIRVESAAIARDPDAIVWATSQMMEKGCLSCHERFRKKE